MEKTASLSTLVRGPRHTDSIAADDCVFTRIILEESMFIETHSADVVIHALSIRLAKQCRHIIQGCLREEEWRDADFEFYRVIRAGLEELSTTRHTNPKQEF
jgi:hypothetical protein